MLSKIGSGFAAAISCPRVRDSMRAYLSRLNWAPRTHTKMGCSFRDVRNSKRRRQLWEQLAGKIGATIPWHFRTGRTRKQPFAFQQQASLRYRFSTGRRSSRSRSGRWFDRRPQEAALWLRREISQRPRHFDGFQKGDHWGMACYSVWPQSSSKIGTSFTVLTL